jgi:5-methyltetrahydropteroyltriglutamate--homocysteine methyltransferase
MPIPTEPIGSIPRPLQLIAGTRDFEAGRITEQALDILRQEALSDTIRRFEATGSTVITDGEQTKPSFATYPVHGLPNLAPDGVTIPFADGHTRQLPRLTSGPFRYKTHAACYLKAAKRYARNPLKQAVISASALSLLYPQSGIPGYSGEEFRADLVREAEADIRQCLEQGAHSVQVDSPRAASRLSSIHQAAFSNISSASTTRCSAGFPPMSGSASAYTPAPVVIGTPFTAPMWTMPAFSHCYSPSRPATSISS